MIYLPLCVEIWQPKVTADFLQLAGVWVLAIVAFCFIRPFIRRHRPKLSESTIGAASWALAWIAVVVLALLVYPFGWK
jgi:hypothetical protein